MAFKQDNLAMRLLFSLVVGLLLVGSSTAQSAPGVPQEVTSQTFEQPDRSLLYDRERLTTYDIEELLYFLTIDAAVVQGENGVDESYIADVREELIRRRAIERLISELENAKEAWYHLQIVFALYDIQDARVRRAFGNYDPSNTDEITYYSVNYLAKLGDPQALKVLNDHFGQYPISSVQWANSVEQFGKYNYKPSVSNLISSLNHMSLNVVIAAAESLAQIYSVDSAQFQSLPEVKEYFIRLYEEEVEKQESQSP